MNWETFIKEELGEKTRIDLLPGGGLFIVAEKQVIEKKGPIIAELTENIRLTPARASDGINITEKGKKVSFGMIMPGYYAILFDDRKKDEKAIKETITALV